MVNKVVLPKELMAITYDMARRIAKNASFRIAFAKRGLQNFSKMNRAQALDYDAYVDGVTSKGDDFMELSELSLRRESQSLKEGKKRFKNE